MNPHCAYCTGEAHGVDEEGEFTCGANSCTPVVGPMPAVIEESNEEEEEGGEQ